jgi:NAD(P)-dependent dehydrogenase (short-subunit alcohol dehydrogenase family)
MRILIVGANGTVGRTVVAALGNRHVIVKAGRSSGDVAVDLTKADSIRAMYDKAGKLDAVVACVGHTHFAPLTEMTEAQFMMGFHDKLMGQVNLVREGLKRLNDGGSFTLTSGILSHDPIRSGTSAASVDAAIDGFVIAAAIEMPRGLRINAVSPGLLQDSAAKYDGFFPGHEPVSSERVGLGYVKSIEGAITGQIVRVI